MGVTAFSRPQEAQIMNYYVPLPFEQIKSMAQPYQQMSDEIGMQNEQNKYIYADVKHLPGHTDVWEAKNKEANEAFTNFYDKNKLDFTQGQKEFVGLTTKFQKDPVVKDLQSSYDNYMKGVEEVHKAVAEGKAQPWNIIPGDEGQYVNENGQWKKVKPTQAPAYLPYIANKEMIETYKKLVGDMKGRQVTFRDGRHITIDFANMIGDKAEMISDKGERLTADEVYQVLQGAIDPTFQREFDMRANYSKLPDVKVKVGKETTTMTAGQYAHNKLLESIAGSQVIDKWDPAVQFIDTGLGHGGNGSKKLNELDVMAMPTTMENTSKTPFSYDKLVTDRSKLLGERTEANRQLKLSSLTPAEKANLENIVKRTTLQLESANKHMEKLLAETGIDVEADYNSKAQPIIADYEQKLKSSNEILKSNPNHAYAKSEKEKAEKYLKFLKDPNTKKLYKEEALGISSRYSDAIPGNFATLSTFKPSNINKAIKESAKTYNTKDQTYAVIPSEGTILHDKLKTLANNLEFANLEVEGEDGELTTTADENVSEDWKQGDYKVALDLNKVGSDGFPKLQIKYGKKGEEKIMYANLAGMDPREMKQSVDDMYNIAMASFKTNNVTKGTKLRDIANTMNGAFDPGNSNSGTVVKQLDDQSARIQRLKKGESARIVTSYGDMIITGNAVDKGRDLKVRIGNYEIPIRVNASEGSNFKAAILKEYGAYRKLMQAQENQ